MTTATSTIVFTDVVGSTSWRARVGEQVADGLFRRLQQALDQVVEDHHGRVVSTAGDGMLAAFDSATDAVQASVALQQRVAGQFADLRIRVGVAAGDVNWEDGDCSGLPVVTAARLEASANGGQILVSSLVRHLAGARAPAQFRSVGVLELKGLPEPVESFEVEWLPLADAGEEESFTVPCPGAVSASPTFAFVGREDEREELGRVWAATKAGERHTVLIGGEAGAGKTRLAFDFARRCAADGAAVLLGVCDTELALPYQPWVQIVDHLVRAMPPDMATSLRDELGDVSLLVPQLERIVPGLRRGQSADPETERFRLFNAVDAILAEAARRRPTVVVIDDLHWASAQTLALLRHVARSGTTSPLLVVGTFRDTGDEITEPLAGCLADLRRTEATSRLRLGSLDEVTVERFVVGAVGHDLDGDLRALASTLAEHSGGNAFYLGELWRHVVAAGVVVRAGDRWSVRPGATGVGVPDSVREVVGNRLTRLSEAARRLLELAAIAGQRVELRVLTRAADLTEDEVGVGLDELVDAKLLIEVSGVFATFQFAHAIVRETVERSVAPSSKARLHLRVGEATEEVYEADRRPVLAQLVRHFAGAAASGGSAKAAYYARRAANQAMRSVAYDEAISHLTLAIELSSPGSEERVDLLLELGTARNHLGLHHDAMATFADAFSAAKELGLVTRAAQAAVGFETAVGLPGLPGGRAVELVSEALALLGEQQGPTRTKLLASLGSALGLTGRLAEAREVRAEALAAARRDGDIDGLMAALQTDRTAITTPRESLRDAREVGELAERRGDFYIRASTKTEEVRALLTLGEVAEARGPIEEERQIADRERFAFLRYLARVFDVVLAVVDGRFDEAERLAERARDFGELARADSGAGAYGFHMYVIRREQGRLHEVAPVLRLAASVPSDEPIWRPGLAALYADEGMIEEARREFDRLAPDGFAAVPRDAVWPGCLTFLAEVCVALGDREQGAVLYRELEPFTGLTMMVGFTVCLGPAERLMGNLAALLGHRGEAEGHFAAALQMAEHAGSRPWRARVQHDWAVALGDRPDLLAAAHATAVELGMKALAEQCLPQSTVGTPPVLPDGLSAREVEVLRLVASGLSNREIGQRLSISPNTASNHVRAILQKTGSGNRAGATAYAARHGLLDAPGSAGS